MLSMFVHFIVFIIFVSDFYFCYICYNLLYFIHDDRKHMFIALDDYKNRKVEIINDV